MMMDEEKQSGRDHLQRKKSLIRPERSKSFRKALSGGGVTQRTGLERSDSLKSLARADTLRRRQLANASTYKTNSDGIRLTWWVRISRILTPYAPPAVLVACCGKKDPIVQQAFREKLALCTIILFIMAIVAFLTFGFQQVLCGTPPPTIKYDKINVYPTGTFTVRGDAYSAMRTDGKPFAHPGNVTLIAKGPDRDFSFLFPPTSDSICSKVISGYDPAKPPISCQGPVNGVKTPGHCHTSRDIFKSLNYKGETIISWDVIKSKQLKGMDVVVFNGYVLDVTRYKENKGFLGNTLFNIVQANIGRDITLSVLANGLKDQASCLKDVFVVARLDLKTAGCFVTDIVLYVSLIFIGGVVLIRFFLAVIFALGFGWRMGDHKNRMLKHIQGNAAKRLLKPMPMSDKRAKMKSRQIQSLRGELNHGSLESSAKKPSDTPHRREYDPSRVSKLDLSYMDLNDAMASDDTMTDPSLMHTLIMVPCYSESFDSIQNTLESIAQTDYPTTHKCIFAIADGIVQGAGNDKPTYQYLLDLMEIDPRFRNEDPAHGQDTPAYSYVAIADGNKRKNYAKVYAGWYRPPHPVLNTKESDQITVDSQDSAQDITGRKHTIRKRETGRVPMVLVVKVGNHNEQRKPKPGNRGKRDSQVILMNFLAKVLFDDRMTELEFDIFYKLFTITGINPERYEAVMMIDADTKIHSASLRHMVAAMVKDPNVIGLCGETKVENKWQSWVSMIQVFEYFISHHLAKGFESLFGIVTCLPGCFSMYRIRAPKGEGFFVPVLANPDIVEEYSENVVDTLHKKNLLLLGEDRYLSTLMLKTFPNRKMIFVPKAVCHTAVPDEFGVLLSQRRRWINSTIHNLFELLKVRDLCGTFCFSMQFIVFMELIGTFVLPAAICFTIYVLASSVSAPELPVTTLALLGAILGLPGLMTVFLANKIQYLFWMLIYLLSLPIWNFVLPLYAFWHFDDFSWGETRRTEGETKGEDHGRREGEFDGSGISMKRWTEWMTERRHMLEHMNVQMRASYHAKAPRMPTSSVMAPPASYVRPMSVMPGFRPMNEHMRPVTGMPSPSPLPTVMEAGRPLSNLPVRSAAHHHLSRSDPRLSMSPSLMSNAVIPQMNQPLPSVMRLQGQSNRPSVGNWGTAASSTHPQNH